VPGAPKKKGGRPKDSPEKKAEKKLLSAQKKAKRLAGVAAGDPEAIAEQAKIDAQVALMQAGKAKKKEIYHQRLALEEDESDVPAMVLAGGGASV
jgi:hypothetical protein